MPALNLITESHEVKKLKKILSTAFFGAATAVLVYAISQTMGYRTFLSLQNMVDDSHFTFHEKPASRPGGIVIIDIDDFSIDCLGNFKNWPRRHFAEVIGLARNSGARIIFLDVNLMEGGKIGDNKALADTIAEAGNVIAGYYFNLDYRSRRERPLDPVYNEKFSEDLFNTRQFEKIEFIRAENVALPFREMVESSKGLGFTNYIPDPDGVVRHIPLYISYNNRLLPSAALQMWLQMKGMHFTNVVISPRGSRFGDTFVPTDKHCFLRLNFSQPGQSYPAISFAAVLDGQYPSEIFKDSVVMIGSSSSTLGDLKKIPGHDSVPGVQIHAAALSTLLERNFITVVSGNSILIFTILSGILAGLFFSFLHPFKAGLPVTFVFPVMLYALSMYSFTAHARLINITIPTAVVILLYFVITIHRTVEYYERRNYKRCAADVQRPEG
jgi:adenylate cyclase